MKENKISESEIEKILLTILRLLELNIIPEKEIEKGLFAKAMLNILQPIRDLYGNSFGKNYNYNPFAKDYNYEQSRMKLIYDPKQIEKQIKRRPLICHYY